MTFRKRSFFRHTTRHEIDHQVLPMVRTPLPWALRFALACEICDRHSAKNPAKHGYRIIGRLQFAVNAGFIGGDPKTSYEFNMTGPHFDYVE